MFGLFSGPCPVVRRSVSVRSCPWGLFGLCRWGVLVGGVSRCAGCGEAARWRFRVSWVRRVAALRAARTG